MTATTIRVQMAQRKDTAANWTAANPILLSGEIGYETDTKKFKIGNGSSNWNTLTYLPIPDGSGNLTITGNLEIGSTGSLTFEGSTADGFETTLAVTNPTADRTITLPNQSGTVLVSGNASIVDADIAANAEIAVSKLADGTARQLLQTDAAGTGVEWTSNVDIPGTLDVTGAATFDATVTVAGDLTVNGTTTTISTQNLLVEDKNIIIGDVASPTDVTADGGGITLKGATDKTINWVDATDAWTSSERFSVPLGSASTPSLTFTGDPNTGIYSPGADQVAISTGGSGRLFVDASGNVGVGTTTAPPAGHIARFSSFVFAPGFTVNSSGDTGIYSTIANTLQFQTNGSEKVRITSAGLVGVGTSSPSYTLDVAGNARIGAATGETNLELGAGATGNRAVYIDFVGDTTYTDYGFRILRTNEGANAPTFLEQRGTGDFAFNTIEAAPLIFRTNSSERLRITPAGNVGIGTTSPSYLLDVAGTARIGATTGDATLEIGTGASANRSAYIDLVGDTTYTDYGTRIIRQGGGANADSRIQHRGTGALALETAEAGASIVFLQQPGERARIDSSGRLLVGTSSIFTGAVNYVGQFKTLTGGGIWVEATAAGDASYVSKSPGDTLGIHFAGLNSAGTIVFRVSQNGDVQNTNNSYGAISDVKLKENIVNASSQWSDIKAIQVRKYNFKEGQTRTQIGLIAQEVELVSPGLVSESPDRDEDGNALGTVTKSVNYSVLYMKAVKALQEAMERIETLEAKVAALEA